MTEPGPDLDARSADVEWTDPVAARLAREHVFVTEGRLAGLVEWLAATQGGYPVHRPARERLVVFGGASPLVAATADSVGAGVRAIEVEHGWTVTSAFDAGRAAADAEVDEGTDLAVVADPDGGAAGAALVSVLTGTEPVALLPRGAQAVDTAYWIRRATELRDLRRRVVRVSADPDALLSGLAHPPLAATAGFVLQATIRRTPLLLDGTAALAAAVLVNSAQPRAAAWWQVADSSPDPVHTRAATQLGLRPVLDLQTMAGDGLAGLLALPVVRAAASLGGAT